MLLLLLLSLFTIINVIILRFCDIIFLLNKQNMNDKIDEKSVEIEKVTSEVTMQPEFSKPEMQEARAFLRERFLQFMSGCVGKQTTFHLYENSQVSGEFRGLDVDGVDIFVRNLETPLGKIPEAIIRTSDVISFDINNIPSSP